MSGSEDSEVAAADAVPVGEIIGSEVHTAGPWTWVRHNDEDRRFHSSDWRLAPGILLPDGASGTPGGDEIDRANARLIAAAPDLLGALKALCALLADDSTAWTAIRSATRRAALAIAKAEPTVQQCESGGAEDRRSDCETNPNIPAPQPTGGTL